METAFCALLGLLTTNTCVVYLSAGCHLLAFWVIMQYLRCLSVTMPEVTVLDRNWMCFTMPSIYTIMWFRWWIRYSLPTLVHLGTGQSQMRGLPTSSGSSPMFPSSFLVQFVVVCSSCRFSLRAKFLLNAKFLSHVLILFFPYQFDFKEITK